ncbi:MAG: HTH domain-containing protein [Clostridiales bacterium]
MDVNAKVLEVLQASGQPMKSAEIAEKAGEDKKAVDKAIKALKAEGKVESPKNCYYAAK